MSEEERHSARLTFSPQQLSKLAGPIVLSTLSGVAALLEEARKGDDSRKGLDRAVDVASRSLMGLYEADFDVEGGRLSVDATIDLTGGGS